MIFKNRKEEYIFLFKKVLNFSTNLDIILTFYINILTNLFYFIFHKVG